MIMASTVICDFDSRASPSTSSDSITDASEDSVDVKVKPVAPLMSSSSSSSRTRNKRKSAEPRKLKDVPIIKRHRWTLEDHGRKDEDLDDDRLECLEQTGSPQSNVNKKGHHRDLAVPSTSSSMVTWSQKKQKKFEGLGAKVNSKKCKVSLTEQNLSENVNFKSKVKKHECSFPLTSDVHGNKTDFSSLGLPFDVRNILGPSASSLLSVTTPISFERLQQSVGLRHLSERAAQCLEDSVSLDFDNVPKDGEVLRTTTPCSTSYLPDVDIDGRSPSELANSSGGSSSRHKQRNYKNMTRERRVEANARERTRVHTISAAFDNLRRAVPSYSCHQKLSKLAILRIACSYILALASLNDQDYSSQQDCPTFSECVDLCTRTIQAEGKARKRKD